MTMSAPQDQVVPVFIPALVTMLLHEEDEKGIPLTLEEVHAIRDRSACIMMEVGDARAMDESRGYLDIDPENCWHDWQMQRRALGRGPDLDPGPRFVQIRSHDAAYQRTIQEAQASLDHFLRQLPNDGTPRPEALVKTRLTEGDESALMWLNNTAITGTDLTAVLFEVPTSFRHFHVGDRLTIRAADVLDWMINEDGRLMGGFSLRYQRSLLSEDEQQRFDDHIGVDDYTWLRP